MSQKDSESNDEKNHKNEVIPLANCESEYGNLVRKLKQMKAKSDKIEIECERKLRTQEIWVLQEINQAKQKL